MTTAIKSVSISLELLKEAENYHLSLSEATRIGIAVMLSDLDEPKYLNSLNVGRKISKMSEVIKSLTDQLTKYELVQQKQ